MSSLFHPNSVTPNLILCPKCYSIPSVTIDHLSHDTITIHCTCSYHCSLSLPEFLTRKVDYTTTSLHHCQFLSSHHTKTANKFCVHCQQWLCAECLTLHNDIKITKNHLLLDHLLTNEIKCRKHNDNDCEFHCAIHNENLCEICYKEHSPHSDMIVSLRDVIKRTEEIKCQLESAKRMIDKYNRSFYEKLECLKRKINEIEKEHEREKERNENLIKVFDVLIDNSKLEISNFNLYNNIIRNVVVNIDSKVMNDKIERLNVVYSLLQEEKFYKFISNNNIYH